MTHVDFEFYTTHCVRVLLNGSRVGTLVMPERGGLWRFVPVIGTDPREFSDLDGARAAIRTAYMEANR